MISIRKSKAWIVTFVAALILGSLCISALSGCGTPKTKVANNQSSDIDKPARETLEAEPKEDTEETVVATFEDTVSVSKLSMGQEANETTVSPSEPPAPTPAPQETIPAWTPPAFKRNLRTGMKGPDVQSLQDRLTMLGYLPGPVNGKYTIRTYHAVMAFQKVNGLPRSGTATIKTLQALSNPRILTPRYTEGDHVEVDKSLQVLLIVKGGKVVNIVACSTAGKGHSTPNGASAVDWKAGPNYRSKKYDGIMVWPSFFNGGVAVHGYQSVPPRPASHGCVRVPVPDAKFIFDKMPVGSMVYVY